MSKKKRGKRRGPQKSFDRHVFSTLVGLALGAVAFYGKRSLDTKTATA